MAHRFDITEFLEAAATDFGLQLPFCYHIFLKYHKNKA